MSQGDIAPQAQAEAYKRAHARRAWARVRNLLLAGLAGVLCLILWAHGMLLPSNLTTATVPGSWVKYGVETSQWSFWGEERPRSLYRSVDPLGVLWVHMPRIYLAHSVDDMHPGVQLVFSPDGSKLFVKRGTALDKRGTAPVLAEPIWSDCIDLTTFPIRSCGGVRTCCMSKGSIWHTDYGVADFEDVAQDSKKVEALARAAGITD